MDTLTAKRVAPARTTRDNTTDTADNTGPQRAAQVARIRRRARRLDYSAVFVSDVPVIAELFDAHGNLADREPR